MLSRVKWEGIWKKYVRGKGCFYLVFVESIGWNVYVYIVGIEYVCRYRVRILFINSYSLGYVICKIYIKIEIWISVWRIVLSFYCFCFLEIGLRREK